MTSPSDRPFLAFLVDISEKRTWPDAVEALESELSSIMSDLPLAAIVPVTRNGNTSGFIVVRDNRGQKP